MNKVVELFGHAVGEPGLDWKSIVKQQQCPFSKKTCYKVRKSDAQVAIGTCTVLYGAKEAEPVVICPTRLIERRQIFTDCLQLLTTHEPGNELHVVQEVAIPGGSVDYFVVSAREGKVRDFVGIELQTIDTTGTVWPERQRLLKKLGVPRSDQGEMLKKMFGMNWKMTAKTILVQMHHKIKTFEHINKKLVLVTQDKLFAYMRREFEFRHLSNPPSVGDSMHFHAYRMAEQRNHSNRLTLQSRFSTDAEGVARCLGLQAEARVEIEEIIKTLEAKISPATVFAPA
ncbi:MAG: NotI family restriction endonuclease [Terracidiphilus sp.]